MNKMAQEQLYITKTSDDIIRDKGDTHSLHLYILISFSSPECLALVSLLPWYLYLQYCLLIDDLGRQRQLFILNQPYIFLRFFSLSARVSPVSHMASITTPLAGVSCASLPLLRPPQSRPFSVSVPILVKEKYERVYRPSEHPPVRGGNVKTFS